MKRLIVLLSLCVTCLGAGALAGFWATRRGGQPVPDGPTVVMRVRQLAELNTLQVAVYKKISFAPDPVPVDSAWGAVWQWLQHSVRRPEGKAIVFGRVRAGIDLGAMRPEHVLARRQQVWVVLPPLTISAEVLPGETEVIGSNLDSAQTAQLLEQARVAFELDARGNPALLLQARRASERAVEALVLRLGFRAVHFVDQLPVDLSSPAPAG